MQRPERERPGRAPGEAEELVRQRVGLAARRAPLHDLLGETPEVLHEHQPEGNGHRPQLADGERLHALESADEALQRVRLESAVRVSHEGPGEAEHARIPFEGTFGELGKLAVEAGREILPDLPDDVVDDVEVVDEPLRGRRDRAFLPDHPRKDSITLKQRTPAVPHAWRQGAAGPAVERRAQARDLLCVLLESFGAEQLVPDGILRVENGRGRGGASGGQGVWVPRTGGERYIEIRRVASVAVISTADFCPARRSRSSSARIDRSVVMA